MYKNKNKMYCTFLLSEKANDKVNMLELSNVLQKCGVEDQLLDTYMLYIMEVKYV